MKAIIQFLSENIESPYLLVTLISALPLLECKGGILTAIGLNLKPSYVYALSYLGSTLAAPLIILIFKGLPKGITKSKRLIRLSDKLFGKYKLRARQLDGDGATVSERKKLLGLMLFVAIPAPMTGVWSGSVIACFTHVCPLKAFAVIALGNAVAAAITLLLAVFLREYIDVVMWFFLGISVFCSILTFVLNKVKKQKDFFEQTS